jgi:hypothetical protein
MDCRTQLASMAIEELDNGDFVMATKILNTRIRLEPNNHEFYFERAICHHKLGNYQASLDDANAAIRLNPSDYNIHYQKGLALIGLSMFPEAVTSFKKAIELRAKQDDSKLSDIFKLLRDATNELNTARRRPGMVTNQTTTPASGGAPSVPASGTPTDSSGNQKPNVVLVNNEPVDSTTDKPPPRLVPITSHPNNSTPSVATIVTDANTSSNLVASSNRNSNQKQCASQITNPSVAKTIATPNTVTSSASQFSAPAQRTIEYNSTKSKHQPPVVDNSKAPDNHHVVMSNNQHNQTIEESMRQPPLAGSPFEWNIRRSERIFLHNTSEPGTSGPHDDTVSNHRFKPGSNPSSVSSGKGHNKRVHDQTLDTKPYQNESQINVRPMNGTSSVVDSEVDVDDSGNNMASQQHSDLDANSSRKRVIVTPSSSMPATSQSSSTTGNKEDSYSSKYKRLRRDRERARRGTSKLCTIKPSDLEELHKSSKSGSEKNYMRVIAPIDGWLYSGQLSVDDNNQQEGDTAPHYVVKLDGDTSGSSYLFTQETVLNDVIKEVRVKSVSELRKGARICCYWSRTYKCLSTGVVTSRTFEATKSLVSVKYDNGDLSALPLEDLRLLPPDYPKYMSNCDPLLLARNGDGMDSAVTNNKTAVRGNNIDNYASSQVIIDCKSSNFSPCATYSKAIRSGAVANANADHSDESKTHLDAQREGNPSTSRAQAISLDQSDHGRTDDSLSSTLDEDTIPPTSETIDFITSEANLDSQDEQIQEANVSRPIANKGDILLPNETQIENSRASSEENNYGVEYRPWVFVGPPKRSKRNGRTYRDTYSAIRRGDEILSVGDSAELMPRDESILPFIAKIDGLWATSRGEMRVRVRWYYRLVETEGEPFELKDGENALFETDHFDENDVQSIWRTTRILSWTDYSKDHMGHVNKPSDGPKIFYLAGYYDPVRRVKHLRSDVKGLR